MGVEHQETAWRKVCMSKESLKILVHVKHLLHVFLEHRSTRENFNFSLLTGAGNVGKQRLCPCEEVCLCLGWPKPSESVCVCVRVLACMHACVGACVCVRERADWRASRQRRRGKTKVVIDDCWFKLLLKTQRIFSRRNRSEGAKRQECVSIRLSSDSWGAFLNILQ